MDNAIKLEAYSLRITARGGFENVKAFLARLEEDQPAARITGVDIRSGSEPQIHDIQIFIQWPFNLSAITKVWEDIDAKKKSLGGAASKKIQTQEGMRTKGANK